MRGLSFWLLTAATICCTPSAALAQSAPEGEVPADTKNEIVVIGTRISGMSAQELGSPVEVFDLADIRSAEPGGGKISDFLRTIPQSVGVFRGGIQSSFGGIEAAPAR